MDIKIQVRLQVHTPHAITVEWPTGQRRLWPSGAHTWDVGTRYRGGRVTPLFRVLGPDPGVRIQTVLVNGDPVHGHDRLVMRRGAEYLLDTRDRNRWEWTNWYHSGRRWDWIYRNSRAGWGLRREWGTAWSHAVDSEWTEHSDQPHHQRRWVNRPHDPCDHTREHDTLVVGECVTEGTSLKQGQAWPELLPGSTINISQSGTGVDANWMNMRRALETFRVDRVIVSLGGWQHRVVRHTRHGLTQRWTIFPGTQDHLRLDQPCLWWTRSERLARLRRERRRFVLRDHRRRGHRILARMVRELEATGLRWWFTAIDPVVYQDLRRLLPEGHLLPFFEIDLLSPCGHHSSARSHRLWADRVRPLIWPGTR